jgi:hypothetical protein
VGCVLLLLILVLPVFLGFGIMGIAGGVASSEACRKCGYPTRGLQAGVCPECGTPILAPGTVTWGWEWSPPWPLRFVCIGLLTGVFAVPCYMVAYHIDARTVRDVLTFEVAEPSELWRVSFRSTGKQWPSSTTRWHFARGKTVAVLHTKGGETISLELLDTFRRARYVDAAGKRVRTADSIGRTDIEAWAGTIQDEATRQSILDWTDPLLHCLELGPSGTHSVESGKGLTVLRSHHTRYEYPPVLVLVLASGVVLAFGSTAVRQVLRHPERRIVLWRPKPNQGAEPL